MVGSILMGRNPSRQMKQLENTMIASRNLVQGAKTLNAVRKALPASVRKTLSRSGKNLFKELLFRR